MKDKRTGTRPTQTEISDYFNYNAETGGLKTFTNDDLICRDCMYVTDSLTICNRFKNGKPNSTFYTSCDGYIKK